MLDPEQIEGFLRVVTQEKVLEEAPGESLRIGLPVQDQDVEKQHGTSIRYQPEEQ